jgi:hypothetical protein
MTNPLEFMNPKKPIGAVAQGALQGGTMGFSDEIAGLANANTGGPEDMAGAEKSYKAGRDPARKDFHDAQEAQPAATTVGIVGGALATPLPKLPVNATEGGAMIGMTTGLGMNERPEDLRSDVESGGLLGAGLGAAGQKIGQGIEGAASGLSKAADDLLTQALGLMSDEIIALKNMGLIDDILSVVKQKAPTPLSGAQSIREGIEGPAIAKSQAGTVVNPSLEVPALDGPNTLENAYRQAYSPNKTRPAPNQMPYADRVASQQLGKVADKGGGGLLPKTGTGLTPSTFKGGIASAMMGKAELASGLGFNKIADGMRALVQRSDMAAGASQVGTGKLLQLIDAVQQSEDPSLEDYLAQEMSPEYRALRMEAADAIGRNQSK